MQLVRSLNRLKLTRLPEAPLFLGGAFAFLIIIVMASTALLERAQRLRDDIDAGVRMQTRADRIIVLLRRMESGQRGYMLTGDPDFLAVYRESEPLMPGALADLDFEVADNPTQKQLWEKALPLIQAKLGEMAEGIRLYDAGNRDAAFELIRGETGLRFMDQIRQRVQDIKEIETSLLAAKYQNARQQEWVLIGVNIVAVSLIIALALISILIVRRANTAMGKAQAVLKDANAELEANVAARTAELRAANEEIQKFAYIVSHDLRSPLVNIMGFTSELETLKGDLFGRVAALQNELQKEHANGGGANGTGAGIGQQDKVLAEDFDEALSFIKASITKMDRLINAVLTISREGNRTLRAEEVDMNALLSNMTKAMAHQTQAAGAEVDVAQLPPLVSDRLALEQIFSNLLDNALKYLRADTAGQIRVKGRTEGNKVVIEVEDNGRGIEARDQERVFELFRRAGPQDRPGEGMGLAHVRALVRRLGGVINVKSTPGKGSTFIVTLPRALHSTKRMSA
jgi:signal transduction histidine kinase